MADETNPRIPKPVWTSMVCAATLLACAFAGPDAKNPKPQMTSAHSSSASSLPFLKIGLADFYETVNPDSGVLPQKEMVGSPPQCYWIRNEAGLKKFGFSKPTQPPATAPSGA